MANNDARTSEGRVPRDYEFKESTPAAASPVRLQGTLHLFAGVGILIMAAIGLWQDVEWLAQPFYAWAWWGYILILDGYAARKRGDSLLTTRRRFFIPICLWSITFWFFFELINARIQNWYYVGVFSYDRWIAGSVFTIAAFATVFMGIFQTMDALNASGLWRDLRGRRRHFTFRLTYLLQAIGLALAGVALVFPHYLAPLIWGSFTLIVDPWNYRRGARSLLRDFEEGDLGLLSRLLLAGLICGVVWESLNFFAPQKWIYTVRGLEGFKVFEMPLLGFLGFPALALDSMAAYALGSSLLQGNRTWEHPDDLSYQPAIHPPCSRALFTLTAGLQVLFWGVVSIFATPINVGSLQVELADLSLDAAEVHALNERGITRPRQFLVATDTVAERNAMRELLGWNADRLDRVRRRAALYTFKGIGRDHGRMLEHAGVQSPEHLATWEPDALLAELAVIQPPALVAPPRKDFVKVWILAARGHSIVQVSR